MDNEKTLILWRGLPGSGKSTVSRLLCDNSFEADQFFEMVHNGKFIPSRLKDAHEWCKECVETSMRNDVTVIGVANTFTQEWEMAAYEELAEKYGYRIHHVIVENRHGNGSVHNVPQETIEKMKNRFQINL